MTPEQLKDLLERAGLNYSDACRLFCISRSALYQWLDFSKAPKNPLVMEHIRKVVMLIDKGVKTGMLPTKHIEKAFRFQSVNNILRHLETA